MRHSYYHARIQRTLAFLIPSDKTLFVVKDIPQKHFPAKQFDYLFLDGSLGKTNDICDLLKKIRRLCHPSTRLIIYQHNHLWQGILTLAERLALKRNEGIHNWLSVGDVTMYLSGAAFDVTRIFRHTMMPLSLFGIGSLINGFFDLFPFFDMFKLDQFIIARPLPILSEKADIPQSVTICLTVRNERGNIEPIVKKLPLLCDRQEILFVEGHSTDGTREEIERVIATNPEKNIRVIGQPGKGQGDAIRVGFKEAQGEVIILYEGDGTSDPRDLYYVWEAMQSKRFEFIEGSRLVYPFHTKAMPWTNKIGNMIFAKWFSFFLGQRVTDVLSGIKAILKKDYELLYTQWGFLGVPDPFGDFELLYGAARMGLKFGEIPIHYYPRPYGTPKTRVLFHGLRLLAMAIRGYWIFRRN
jgi:hypothetical protein